MPEITPVKTSEPVKPPVVVATPPVTPPPVEASTAPSDDQFDDLGYAKPSVPPEEKKPEVKLDPKVPPKEIEVKATGYGKEPPKVEVVPPIVEPKKDVDLGFELKVDEIIPKDEVSKIKEFAKTHALTQTAAQAYLDMRTSEAKQNAEAQAQSVKNYENQIANTRASWYKELKDDPTFGGDKFDHNVQRAEKVLEEFMPGTKKILTERGSVLPPYVMRDLAKMADHLYSTESLPQGGPIEPEIESEDRDDSLDFYNQKV